MSKQSELETALRLDVLEVIRTALSEHYDTDVIDTGSGEIAIPLLDADKNEKFAVVKVSIPRGTRNGNGYTPYDGYMAGEMYAESVADKELKKKASEEKKQREKEQREQRRAVRKAVKNLENAMKNVE